MAAIDVISLEEAKNWLSIDPDETEWDGDIERLIATAVAWVENYTSYYFYARPLTVQTNASRTGFSQFPITINSVANSNAVAIPYQSQQSALKLWVFTQTHGEGPYNALTINATIGYNDPALIPPPLIDVCLKLITYLYENRDMYTAQLPNDIQVLINQYRRGII